MLGKLAIRNAFRSIRDYRIYIITVTIAFALMYAFNMIVFSEDIMMLNRMMLTFAYMVVFISILVVFVIGWLVHYMTKFMLHRRSKELRHIYGARNQQSCNYKIVSGRKYHNRWNLIFAGDDIRNIFISCSQ